MKEKRATKTKEQVARELQVKAQQEKVKIYLYPAVVAATTSVDEAKMLLRAVSTAIMEESMEVLRVTKMEEVKDKIVKKLCPDGLREKEVRAMIESLDAETLFDSRNLLEGLNSAIEQMIIDEMRNRTLNSFDVDWKRIFGG